MRVVLLPQVEEILAKRGSGSSLEYKVKWAKHKESTWEPASNLEGAATEAIDAFKAKLAEKRKSAGGDKKAEKATGGAPEKPEKGDGS